MKKWDYFYEIQGTCQEFKQQAGQQYEATETAYALNRYGGLLSGSWALVKKGTNIEVSKCTILPLIEELDQHESVQLILEDWLQLPQIVLPPAWADDLPMPLVPEIDATIAEKQGAIALLEMEIADQESKKAALQEWKKLVYASSFELEDIFANALGRCGGKISPARYSQEEFVLEYREQVHLVECKGVGKSISMAHYRQLADYMLRYEEETELRAKGILFGNPWRDRPIGGRNLSDSPIFPANVVARAIEFGVALVWSVDFFRAFCRVLTGEISGNALLDRITGAVGVVNFNDLLE